MTGGGSSPLVLGFDARQADPAPWDEGRRTRFLLRLDVLQPLSIDRMVWPSVFDLHPELAPPYVGPYGYWEDLGDLRRHVDASRATLGDAWLAAFAVVTTVCAADEWTALDGFLRGIHPDGTPGEHPSSVAHPAAVEESWSFLGYDVADLGGISGLANCGFLPEREDIAALRDRWAPRLNSVHLFGDLGAAREFKEFSNRRVPEHAPFFVLEIWRVGAPLRALGA
jgi:hypothetical protein